MGLRVQAARCTGCRICENFCSFHHEGRVWPARTRIVVRAASDEGPFTPHPCRQCEDAPCAVVCSVEAIRRDAHSTAWVVDDAQCTGCGTCVEACPFGAIFLDEARGVAYKCDLCGGEPECVAVCPTAAVTWSD